MTVDLQTIIIIALVLDLFGWGYAAIVRHLRRRDANHGQTAWFVALGVAVVGIGYAVVAGIEQAAIMMLLFAAAGIPMIAEYIDAHTDWLARRRQAEHIRDVNDEGS